MLVPLGNGWIGWVWTELESFFFFVESRHTASAPSTAGTYTGDAILMQGFLVIQCLLSEVELKDRGTFHYSCPDVLFEEIYRVEWRHLELENTACASLDRQVEAFAWHVPGQGPRRSEDMFIALKSVRRHHRVGQLSGNCLHWTH